MSAVLSDADSANGAGSEGSPGIIYLNLKSRPDRRAAMERQLSELGLAARRIEACTPEDLAPHDLDHYCNPSRSRFVSPRELACTFSHRWAWETMVEARVASALVLEDDAVLSRQLPLLLPELLALAQKWDVVRVEANAGLAVTLGPELDCGLKQVSFRRPLTAQWGAGAYFVSRAGAEKLLRWDNLAEPVDRLMMEPAGKLFGQLSIIQSVPGLCSTPPSWTGDSDLQLSRLDRD